METQSPGDQILVTEPMPTVEEAHRHLRSQAILDEDADQYYVFEPSARIRSRWPHPEPKNLVLAMIEQGLAERRPVGSRVRTYLR